MGRTDVEDALLRLDTLTKEENLMTAARNLEVTHHVDDVVRDVDDNVKAAKGLMHDVDGNVKATNVLIETVGDHVKVIERTTSSIDHSVKITKHGAHNSLFACMRIPNHFSCCPE